MSRGSLSRREIEDLREKVIDLVGKKPEKAVTVLTAWVKQTDRPKKTSIKAPKIQKKAA